MGNLFTSEPKRPTPSQNRAQYFTEQSYTAPQTTRPSTTYSQSSQYNREPSFQTQYYASSQPRVQSVYQPQPQPQPHPRTNMRGPNLTAAVYKTEDTKNWQTKSSPDLRNKYTLVTLHPGSADYDRVLRMFRTTAQKQLQVQKIQRVENPYLLACYILKREELNSRSYNSTTEENYFHGTKAKNVASICSDNFDWRLHGDSLGNRFGQGVSFSPLATYSSYYCDRDAGSEKTMFLARVLVTDITEGSSNMIIPPNGCDTAVKKSNGQIGHVNQVVVKFCDSEFYPEFIIYYTGTAVKNTFKH